MNKRVRVWRRHEKGFTCILRKGLVVGETTSFFRVMDCDPQATCHNPEHAEWFSIQSKNAYCEVVE
ncbi:MAG TPA: hypothetical protein VIV15_11135 [Anaerolineales bacterium]